MMKSDSLKGIKIRISILLCAVGFVSVLSISSCDKQKSVPASDKGKILAEQHCQRCHKLPEPEMLDRVTWEKRILLRMGAFLGIFHNGVQYFDSLPAKWLEPGEGGQIVLKAGVYPSTPAMSRSDWELIRSYFIQNAPEHLSLPAKEQMTEDTTLFRVHRLQEQCEGGAAVTAIKLAAGQSKIFAAFYKQRVVETDLKGKVSSLLRYDGAPVQIIPEKDRFVLVDIGNIRGLDTPLGVLSVANSFQDLKRGKCSLKWQKMQRPVRAVFTDLDADGREDIVLCQFGNLVGKISWFHNSGEGYDERILNPEDGSATVSVEDIDKDGRKDVIALMANADEGIDIYLNRGAGNFEKKRVLRFDPVNGSTSLQVLDWDADGDLDLLYGNGDNGDYDAILKPYHGIRLYLNDGSLNFKEAFFLPMNGVYRALAFDFDGDGDKDIAAVSFYPDFSDGGREGIVLFRTDGSSKFTRFTVPGSEDGRWMIMDAEDADGDGDTDILAGAFNAHSSEVPDKVRKRWADHELPLLFLENKSK